MAKPPVAAPLFKALGEYKSILISVGCFTALINLLMLVPSIYMLQVYDRVLSSQNETTLMMLTLMVVGFFAFIGLLEVIRSFIVIRIGSQLERRFNLRVYKAAFSHEEARRIIVEGRGHHFDPDVVDAFMEIHEEFAAIAARFADTEPNSLTRLAYVFYGHPGLTRLWVLPSANRVRC